MRGSIRWRLPLSYATLALLTALALGAILLATLSAYYDQRERRHLAANAAFVADSLGRMLAEGASPDALQAQAQVLAFIAQARVQLLDGSKQVLADSGPPDLMRLDAVVVADPATVSPGNVLTGTAPPGSEASPPAGGGAYGAYLTLRSGPKAPTRLFAPLPTPAGPLTFEDGQWPFPELPRLAGDQQILVASDLPARRPFLGDLGGPQARSPLTFSMAVRNPQTGAVAGAVVLSDGPSYGREVLPDVGLAWGVAGLCALVLAAGVGWLLSRQITRPVLALAGAAKSMAGGDLNARAAPAGSGEFGVLERAFNSMADQVQETVAALRRFVADAAHELNTPLTSLQMDLELLAEDVEGARPAALVDRARGQVAQLETLASDLLQLSRLDARALQEERQPLDLTALLRGLSDIYASRAEQAGLVLEVALPASPLYVDGSAGQVRRAVGNLLDNAIKFTAPGGKVHLGLEQAGERVEIKVEDTGIGIPSGDLPRIGERFYRAANAGAYSGHGLGLAIVQGIARLNQGKLRVESGPGGTTFTLDLPAAPKPPQG